MDFLTRLWPDPSPSETAYPQKTKAIIEEIDAGLALHDAQIATKVNTADVQDVVAAAIALDDTVALAAAAAVDDEIAGRDILEGAPLLSEVNDGIVFSAAGDDNSRSWLEIAATGGPTQHSIDKIAELVPIPVEMNSGATGLVWAIVGDDDSRSDLELGTDGRFTQRVIDSIGERITGGPSLASWVICSGDSMTAGAGGTPYPTALDALETGWNVINMGVGGENSSTIAGRMGGRPMLAEVDDWEIPTTGGVTVTLASDDGEHAVTPLLQIPTNAVNPVRIAGMEGTLSESGGTYTFTRSLDGDAVPVLGPVAMSCRPMRDYRSGIHVIWWGTNDFVGAPDFDVLPRVIPRIRALTEWLTDPVPRYVVIAPTAGYGRLFTDFYLQEFGRRFIDALTYLKSDAAFTESGITKTGTDTSDITANVVPTSFRSDSTHLNTDGYALVAKLVRDRIQEFGWL